MLYEMNNPYPPRKGMDPMEKHPPIDARLAHKDDAGAKWAYCEFKKTIGWD